VNVLNGQSAFVKLLKNDSAFENRNETQKSSVPGAEFPSMAWSKVVTLDDRSSYVVHATNTIKGKTNASSMKQMDRKERL
jgi:hypothetical protein